MTRMGVVVGCRVPPAGSTVTPIRSARASPVASSGAGPARGWLGEQPGLADPAGGDEPHLVDPAAGQAGQPGGGDDHRVPGLGRDHGGRPAGRGGPDGQPGVRCRQHRGGRVDLRLGPVQLVLGDRLGRCRGPPPPRSRPRPRRRPATGPPDHRPAGPAPGPPGGQRWFLAGGRYRPQYPGPELRGRRGGHRDGQPRRGLAEVADLTVTGRAVRQVPLEAVQFRPGD